MVVIVMVMPARAVLVHVRILLDARVAGQHEDVAVRPDHVDVGAVEAGQDGRGEDEVVPADGGLDAAGEAFEP